MPIKKGYQIDELIPPEGDKRVGPRCYQLVMDVIQDKSDLGLHTQWQRWYELGRNKHWKLKSDKVPQVSINLLDKHRQKLINQLTDNNPTFNVRGVGMMPDGQEDVVNKLLKASEFWWNETEQQEKLALTVYNGETYGITVEKVIFNPDLELRIGEVETVLVDPYHFGLYPVKCMDIQKAQACLHYYPMCVREAKRKWPELSDKIKSDSSVIRDLGETRRETRAKDGDHGDTGMMVSIASEVKQILGFSGEQNGEDEDETLVCEVWCKDYTQEEGEDKYPGNIRKITICSCGEVVLEDVPNPSINPELSPEEQAVTYLFDKFPFIDAHAKEDTSTFWSPSDFENLEDLNLELNKSISQFKIGKDKAARSKLVNPKTSGVSNDQLTSAPGILNPANSQHGISYIEPPPLPPDIMASIDLYKQLFFVMSEAFTSEQTQGPGRDVLAYKAIAALIEQATISLRGKVRSYSKLIRERGRMYISHLMNWYTEDRWVTFDEDGEQKMEAINGRQMLVPVKLSVVSGSTMPVSRVQQREEALALAKMGMLPPEFLFEKLDYSNRKDIVKKIESGPIGMVMEKLSAVFPPNVMKYLDQIARMDPKDFKKAREQGHIQPIPLANQQPQGPDPVQQQGIQLEFGEKQASIGKQQAETQRVAAEAQKVMAEIELVKQQIVTEQVKQQVSMKGISFDEQKLIMERAKVVKELEAQDRMANQKDTELDIKRTAESAKRGPYAENGLTSNNLEVTE